MDLKTVILRIETTLFLHFNSNVFIRLIDQKIISLAIQIHALWSTRSTFLCEIVIIYLASQTYTDMAYTMFKRFSKSYTFRTNLAQKSANSYPINSMLYSFFLHKKISWKKNFRCIKNHIYLSKCSKKMLFPKICTDIWFFFH